MQHMSPRTISQHMRTCVVTHAAHAVFERVLHVSHVSRRFTVLCGEHVSCACVMCPHLAGSISYPVWPSLSAPLPILIRVDFGTRILSRTRSSTTFPTT